MSGNFWRCSGNFKIFLEFSLGLIRSSKKYLKKCFRENLKNIMFYPKMIQTNKIFIKFYIFGRIWAVVGANFQNVGQKPSRGQKNKKVDRIRPSSETFWNLGEFQAATCGRWEKKRCTSRIVFFGVRDLPSGAVFRGESESEAKMASNQQKRKIWKIKNLKILKILKFSKKSS